MKNRIYTILLMFGCFSTLSAQTKPVFQSPFNFPLVLSSNFGELRSNHFHGGLDIKTQGQVGKPIHCIADGYVSRVSVSFGGYGQAIYINHYNGYTSVYGHVLAFSDRVQSFVKDYQYKHETFAVDLNFEPNQIKFKAGDVIALSGNEGFSFGPHLHFEIRKTDNNEYVNPLPFYKQYLKDTRAPQATSVTFYPELGKGSVMNASIQKSIPVAQLHKPIEAWGEIGLGIKAFDYMDGTYNHYGVYSVTLLCDTHVVYKSVMNEFLPNENRMINAYTDYKAFKNHNSWIMRSYRLPGNTLQLMHTDSQKGWININQERNYNFKYILEDLYGNKKSYSFVVKGKKMNIIPYAPTSQNVLYYNKSNVIQEPGMQLTTSRGMVYDNVWLNLKVTKEKSNLSDQYQLHNEPVALHAPCELMIGLKQTPVKDSSKYYIARVVGNGKWYVGNKYEKGWVKADIKELGTYRVEIDTISPRISPLYVNQWRSGNIQFRVSDKETGIKNYKVFIDKKFEVFAYSLKNGKLTMKYPKRFASASKHQIDVLMEDNCNNILHKVYYF